jgi:hypothetical protein
MTLPAGGPWMMKILARQGRFVVGVYRRQMQAISYLGTLDRLFGVSATTRNWNTITAIFKVLGDGAADRPPKSSERRTAGGAQKAAKAASRRR